MIFPSFVIVCLLTAEPPAAASSLPEIHVAAANTRIDRSCRVVVEPEHIIEDSDGNGVLSIEADDITVEFAEGTVLRGATWDVPDDHLVGAGIRIKNHKGVTIRNARIEGYKAGIFATSAPGLKIENVTVGRAFRQRLRSIPRAEDAADWLSPHDNDGNEWLARYGAAAYIEDSDGVFIHDLTVRRSQNGIVLDRVNDAKVYDNDCSYLSGWGLAMWRSGHNLVSRNAFDFCIRGYSHGVYNRGQDSAGILLFEQSSDNAFIENSATHGGDGFFCFAGKEALGEEQLKPEMVRTGVGCNGNLLTGNDFSFAAAHGVELTFGFNNWIVGNRMAGNAICGLWGGYSQRTMIMNNQFTDNGVAGAGEGGGINIEHGCRNQIMFNRFGGNSVDVSFWDDDDTDLLKTPWAKVNHKGSTENFIGLNEWSEARRVLRVRRTPITLVPPEAMDAVKDRVDADDGSKVQAVDSFESSPAPKWSVADALGSKHPVGARKSLDGRESIYMGEFGPWDHTSGMIRLTSRDGARHSYEMFGDVGAVAMIGLDGSGDVGAQFGDVEPGLPRALTVGTRPGVLGLRSYEFRVQATGIDQMLRGTLVSAQWAVRMFAWDESSDPRSKLEEWRKKAASPDAAVFIADEIGASWMKFGSRGPREVSFLADFKDKLPNKDHFGLIATTKLNIPPGKWRFKTTSDDGVRVTVGGKTVIENWTLHAPVQDIGYYAQSQAGDAEIVVEWFQVDGNAEFDLEIEAVGGGGK